MTTFELDDSQRAAVSTAAEGTHFRIVGPPGSGKTTVVTEIVAALIARDGESAVRILTPSRQAATRLRDVVAMRVGVPTRGPLARSVSSLAFEIVSAEQGNGFTARLMSGGEQDSDIKALLDGEIADGADGYWPASLNADVRRLREFRTQLRDLLSRSRDLGLVDETSDTPFAALAQLAATAEFGAVPTADSESPYAGWTAAATFLTTYRRLVARSRAGQVDPAELVDRARNIIESTAPDARRMALVVDDAHDLTPSQWRFVMSWAHHRGPVIAAGDPDVSTSGFRGGHVTFLDDSDVPWGSTHALSTIHRQGGVMPSSSVPSRPRSGAAYPMFVAFTPVLPNQMSHVRSLVSTCSAQQRLHRRTSATLCRGTYAMRLHAARPTATSPLSSGAGRWPNRW